MEKPSSTTGVRSARSLFRPIGVKGRAIGAILFASLLPLALCCAGVWDVACRAQRHGALEFQGRIVGIQASAIEEDLAAKLGDLARAARTVSLDVQGGGIDLEIPRRALNERHEGAFVDLGVIGWDGGLLARAGTGDLMARSYAEEDWFRAASREGSCICQAQRGVGEGSRFVMAVRRRTGASWWVLAASVDGKRVDAIVDAARWGSTGEARLAGATCGDGGWPVAGAGRDRRDDPALAAPAGISGGRVLLAGAPVLLTTGRLDDDRWVLAVQQDEAEILLPLYGAFSIGALMLLVCVFFLVNTTIVTVRHLVDGSDPSSAGGDSVSRRLASGMRFGRRARQLE